MLYSDIIRLAWRNSHFRNGSAPNDGRKPALATETALAPTIQASGKNLFFVAPSPEKVIVLFKLVSPKRPSMTEITPIEQRANNARHEAATTRRIRFNSATKERRQTPMTGVDGVRLLFVDFDKDYGTTDHGGKAETKKGPKLF